MSWGRFEAEAGPLAAVARGRFEDAGLVLLGTLRRDGGPRISPVEPLILDGRLYLGMMWRSMKALDLRRDPRCVVHSVVTTTEGTEGDVKLYGRGVEITDAPERDRYGVALFDRIGWRPTGDFHLFVVDVEEVGYFRVEGTTHRVWHWRPGEPLGDLETRPGTS
ncbi:MAG TPA: pyridoxamine 5'-phosphate oxidase family protein [Acidimicrobiales bacterium]|nr:pyridoxamine 5'-phosphate oxidase family protein [Acidimicrobiales bacterium]